VTETKESQSGDWLFLAAMTFMLFGAFGSPLFLGVSAFLFAAAEYRRNKIFGAVGAVAALLLLLLMLGYGFGKDLALRDNARTATELPASAP
jgi:hypothetical protein